MKRSSMKTFPIRGKSKLYLIIYNFIYALQDIMPIKISLLVWKIQTKIAKFDGILIKILKYTDLYYGIIINSA